MHTNELLLYTWCVLNKKIYTFKAGNNTFYMIVMGLSGIKIHQMFVKIMLFTEILSEIVLRDNLKKVSSMNNEFINQYYSLFFALDNNQIPGILKY